MNRRTFSQMLGGLVASAVLPWTRTAAEESPPATSADHVHMAVPTGPPQQIAMVIHPRCIPLDVFGPQAVLAGLGNVQVHLVWKTRDAVVAASGGAPPARHDLCGVSARSHPPVRAWRLGRGHSAHE